jgi:ATP-dependent Lon protease
MESENNYDEEIKQDQSGNLVILSDNLPDNLIVLPLQDRPVFPGLTIPLFLNGHRYLNSLKIASERQPVLVGVAAVKEMDEDEIFNSELYRVGTVLKILKVNQIQEDVVQIIGQAIRRFKMVRLASNGSMLRWEVKYYYENDAKPDDELKAYTMAIASSIKELLSLNPIFQEQLKMLVSQMTFDKPGLMMDLLASMLSAEPARLQEILETFDLHNRAKKLMVMLKEEKEILQIQEKIKSEVEEKINKQQKEFFLREQLKVIKKELGLEKDGKSVELEKFEKRIQGLTIPGEAAEIIKSEMDRLRILEPNSPEFSVSRTYLEVLTDLPWGKYTNDVSSIAQARKVLESDHYGLHDVKDRILEFISTIIKRGKLTGSNILLVGPPGVGKTSVGKSIASALGRKFFRFSVGGMRDEAEIKGHRRTYIGAMPGKLIESLRRTCSSNPVIMLDELDKMGMSFQGDPGSALLEVLDPEQNRNFLDHYLDVRFDLSNVLFIATANQLDTIPGPLLDRMEIIRLSGYIMEEKAEIARRYLIPRQRKEHGLAAAEVEITKSAINRIIDDYAREAGVRNLENQVKKIMRRVTLKQAEGNMEKVTINKNNLEDFLGKPVFHQENLYNKDIAGVALGLAYTPLGGATLYIEANSIKGTSGFQFTGQLGNIMQESAQIAYSYIRALTDEDEKVKNYFNEHSVHLHVPAGATPKDGPSAGVTMALALYSLVYNKPVKLKVAMTGELTLTGKVLPIGGVKEKTLAAKRVGVKNIILPIDNRKDFEELQDSIKNGLNVSYADYFIDILKVVYREP